MWSTLFNHFNDVVAKNMFREITDPKCTSIAKYTKWPTHSRSVLRCILVPSLQQLLLKQMSCLILQHIFYEYMVLHRTCSFRNSRIHQWLDCRRSFLLAILIKSFVWLMLFRLMPIFFEWFPFSQSSRRRRAYGRCADGNSCLNCSRRWRPNNIRWATCICYRQCRLFGRCRSARRTLDWQGLVFHRRWLAFTAGFLKHVDNHQESTAEKR